MIIKEFLLGLRRKAAVRKLNRRSKALKELFRVVISFNEENRRSCANLYYGDIILRCVDDEMETIEEQLRFLRVRNRHVVRL